MTCPVCGAVGLPAASESLIDVCGSCGASCVQVDADTWRRATARDTVNLNEGALRSLQKARAALARPGRNQR